MRDGVFLRVFIFINRFMELLEMIKDNGDGTFSIVRERVVWDKKKPLTDAEIHEVWKSVTKNKFRGCHIDLVRAIEVKHGIRDIFRWHWEE